MNRRTQTMMKMTHRSLRRPLLILILTLLATVLPNQADARKVPIAEGLTEYKPWSAEIVELFRKLPVQDDGRIKPLETLARFRLYHLAGKRSLKFDVDDGNEIETHKISAVEWYLDCLFRPEVAKKLPCLLVDNTAVLSDIGLQPPGAARAGRGVAF